MIFMYLFCYWQYIESSADKFWLYFAITKLTRCSLKELVAESIHISLFLIIRVCTAVHCVCQLGFPQYLLFRTLGLCLALADPPAEHHLQILNDVWRVVSRLSDPGHYVSCAEVWVQFAVRHFSVCAKEYGTKELLFLQALNTISC